MAQCHFITSKWSPVYGYNSKIIGKSNGQIFRKTIKGSLHLLRKPPAIAIDATAYEHEISKTHQYIEVFDTDTNNLYISSIENFNKHKGLLDRGHGRQYYLSLCHWQLTDQRPIAARQLVFSFGVGNGN